MKDRTVLLRSPDSQTASTGGSNGDGAGAQRASDPRAVLAQIVAQREAAPAPELEAPPTGAEDAPPENAPAPPAEASPGQENLPAEETPPADAGAEPAAAEGEPGNQTSDDAGAELTSALAALSPAERASALELAKSLQPGEIPRIAKLISERHTANQTIEALQKQNEELQAKVESGPAHVPAGSTLPEAVAKLNTIDELKAYQKSQLVTVDFIEELFDLQPYNGDPDAKQYKIGEQEFTRRELLVSKKAAKAELQALPERAQQIAQSQNVKQAREAGRKQSFTDFPWLQDKEHPVTKRISQALKEAPQLSSTLTPEYWAAVYLMGLDAMNADLGRRKPASNGSGKPLQALSRPAGRVPAGKPHTAGGTGGGTQNGAAAKAALEGHLKSGSRNSLAAVIAAGGL